MNLKVRDIQLKDIQLITNYWLTSNDDYLIGLGVDLDKIPSKNQLVNMLTNQIKTNLKEKQSNALIWEINDEPIGHSNVNNITFGKEATMHLHIWNQKNRKKGTGVKLLKLSFQHFFDALELKRIICVTYAGNDARNRILEKVGFKFIKKYKTTPGYLNFEQNVNRWELNK
jgi:RimJ/RimL family protein N-acetyltransferase